MTRIRRSCPGGRQDKIGREEDERDIRGQFGQEGCDLDIEFARQGRIRLTRWASAQGGAMDDELRSPRLKGVADGCEIRQIKLAPREGNDLPRRRASLGRLHKIVPDQPAGSGDPSGGT